MEVLEQLRRWNAWFAVDLVNMSIMFGESKRAGLSDLPM
jgi:hypothetical protein